ncbi:MAG TPA: DUF3465 domain-containing protein [Pyrinomonadaceae bacterium]|nr:DUF3465 domain-containing protein [Pyrinomonadaceae bacterium]
MNKKFGLLILILCCLSMLGGCASAPAIESGATVSESDQRLAQAFDQQETDLQVEGTGTVSRILSDDNDGSRHQRFIIALKSGQTVLISHNIDLAPRIISLEVGDEIRFFGEYEWNDKGGTIHWTHHDPNRRHIAGWIKHEGRVYQ